MTARPRRECARAPKRCRRCCRRLRKADGRTELNEKSTMRLSQRLIAATVLVALSAILAGCSSMSNFDPMDMIDFVDTKKKLPGDRKPVFPEGVPGLEQGVPRDMYKGAQQQQDAPAVAALPAEPPPAEPPKSAKSAKGKKAKQPAATA